MSGPSGLQRDSASPRQPGGSGSDKKNGQQLRTVDVPAETFRLRTEWISGSDLYQLAMLPFLTVIAWLFSDRLCASFCRGLAMLLYRIRPGRYGSYARIFRQLPQENGGTHELNHLVPEAAAMRQLERLQLLRYHRPGGWSPPIRLAGKDHLDRALAAGKGAILWVPHSIFSEIAFKKALHDNGYADWHVSRPDHGHFSLTRFGVRVLNPIRVKVEDHYLAERVVLDPADPISGLARMAGQLAKNRILSITVQAFASRLTVVPYGERALLLPSGPPLLSLKTGAPLLPIFTERCPDGSFLVTIAAPLETTPGAGREERVTQMLCRMAEIMYAYFQHLPSQYHFAYLHGITETLCGQTGHEAA